MLVYSRKKGLNTIGDQKEVLILENSLLQYCTVEKLQDTQTFVLRYSLIIATLLSDSTEEISYLKLSEIDGIPNGINF